MGLGFRVLGPRSVGGPTSRTLLLNLGLEGVALGPKSPRKCPQREDLVQLTRYDPNDFKSEQKLISEMMKCAQQLRRTLRHESQHQLKRRGTMRIVQGSQNHTPG